MFKKTIKIVSIAVVLAVIVGGSVYLLDKAITKNEIKKCTELQTKLNTNPLFTVTDTQIEMCDYRELPLEIPLQEVVE